MKREAASPAPPGASLSVVIPTLGRERVLLDTVAALLQSPLPAAEILVVDQTPAHDPATDAALAAWGAAGRIRHLRLREPGVVGAMNRGLREATGSLVLFLDDDLLPGENLVEAHRQAHARFPEAWAVAGRVLQPEGPAGRGGGAPRPARGAGRLLRDLDFTFDGTEPAWVENVMAGNLSVKRAQALALGGFDESFLPPVSYRFETEFAKRLVAAGGRIRFEPSASVRHLRAARGGTRSLGSHLTSASPLHGVGDYYYALRCGRGAERLRYLLRRPFREVGTRFHLRHPWWIPVKLVGELRALCLGLALHRRKGQGGVP